MKYPLFVAKFAYKCMFFFLLQYPLKFKFFRFFLSHYILNIIYVIIYIINIIYIRKSTENGKLLVFIIFKIRQRWIKKLI